MEKPIWVYAHYNIYSKETEYQVSSYERSSTGGDVLIEKQTLTFETPNDKELRVKLSFALKDRLNDMRAEHHKAEMDLSETINTLLSLEYMPAAEAAVASTPVAPPSTNAEDDIPF